MNRNLSKPIMDLKKRPTQKQLRQLVSSCDDKLGHHILWVDYSGIVHLTRLPKRLTSAEWSERMKGKVKFRYETFVSGRGYVGIEAAKDIK